MKGETKLDGYMLEEPDGHIIAESKSAGECKREPGTDGVDDGDGLALID